MKIDVAVCTYQSEKYLEQCLTSIEETVPINRLIIVDHYSTDRTIEIAKKHNAVIYFENVGLGHSRQIAIEHSETPILLFVDSDVVFYEHNWFERAVSLLSEEDRVGAVAVWTPPRLPQWRQKYVDFWWRNVPAVKGYGFSNVYLLLRKAIENIRIPNELGAYEQVYIRTYLKKRGWTWKAIPARGIHYYDFSDEKGAWLGAGNRVFYGIRMLPYFMMRRVVTAPLKGVPPALVYNDPMIIMRNAGYWINYLKGWLHPERYIVMKRES